MGRTRENWRIFKRNKQVFTARKMALLSAVLVLALCSAQEVQADCTTLGSSLGSLATGEIVTCDTDSPNPETTPIATDPGAGGSGVTINLNAGAGLSTGSAAGITLNSGDDNAIINMATGSYISGQAEGILGSNADNQLISLNGGSINTDGVGINLGGDGHTITLNNASVISNFGDGIWLGSSTANSNKVIVNGSSIYGSYGSAYPGGPAGEGIRIAGGAGANNNTVDITGNITTFNGIGILISGNNGTANANSVTLNSGSLKALAC